MTDKEQIEEMTKVILQGTDKYCALVLGSKEDKPVIHYEKFLAEALYNAGCRKITPNVDFVVRAGELSSIQEKARKETAKEILSLLLSDEYICYFDVAVVKEIAQKYGEEIEK